MLAKTPMFRKPCRKNQNSLQPDRTPAPPQPEKAPPPSVYARIINRLKYLGLQLLTLENLGYLGVSLFIGGIGSHAISGNASVAIVLTLLVVGSIVLVTRGALANVLLPSVDVRIKITNALFCLGLWLFIGGINFSNSWQPILRR